MINEKENNYLWLSAKICVLLNLLYGNFLFYPSPLPLSPANGGEGGGEGA